MAKNFGKNKEGRSKLIRKKKW